MAALATHVRHAVGKALRETGSAMERAGMALGGDQSFWDHASRHTTNQNRNKEQHGHSN